MTTKQKAKKEVSAQLQCDKSIIRATVGGRFNVACTYNKNQLLFNKKYWCLGESRISCEILMDTDGFTKAELKSRVQITETYRTFHILMTGLQVGDSGVYWAAIEKMYADIVFKIQVEVTEETVSKPKVWPVGSLLLTCGGQPLTLRCRSERGTNVQYGWYRKAHPEAVLLQTTSDLPLHCASLTQDGLFICSAHNTVSRERSNAVFIHALQPGEEDCVYLLMSADFESYDCRTTAQPITTTVTIVEVFSSTFVTQTSGYKNQSPRVNQTQMENFLLRSWSGVPLWYDIVRWILFTVMMLTTGLAHMCAHRPEPADTDLLTNTENTSDCGKVFALV